MAAGCDDFPRVLEASTPAPTEAIRREVVRLDVTRSPSPTPTPPATPAPTATPLPGLGQDALIVGTDGRGLNGRSGPSLAADIKASFVEGSAVRLLEGPVEADGYTWWRVQGDGGDAWVASRWLQFEAPASQTSPAGTQTPAWRDIR